MKKKIQEKIKSFYKYVVLFPLIFILASCSFYSAAYTEIINERIEQKSQTITNFVDNIATSIDYLTDQGVNWQVEESYSDYVRSVVETIDTRYMVFGAVYNEDLQLISKHHESEVTAHFDPMVYGEFVDKVSHEERGFSELTYYNEKHDKLKWKLYFRWVPTNKNVQGRVLVVTAVCGDSVKTTFSSWVSVGIIVQTVLSVVLQIWLVIEIQKKQLDRKG